MKKVIWAVVLVAIAALALFSEDTPQGAPVRAGFAVWLGANALPDHPETITAIELPSGAGGIRALDAALVLRGVLRGQPKGIVFLEPIAPGEAESLLLSKLSDAKVPVVFTANAQLVPLPEVSISQSLPPLPALPALLPEGHAAGGARTTPAGMILIAARQQEKAVASNVWQFCLTVEGASKVTGNVPGTVRAGTTFVPVDAAGCAKINALATGFLKRITLDQLMLRTDRSERGAINVDLENLFRDRLVAVQFEGSEAALGLAALRNRLDDADLPQGLKWFGLLVVATLPWWRMGRINRALLALGITCVWLLASLSLYQEWRLVMPYSFALLPLLALLPPGPTKRLDKVEEQELPA